ncbi:hypothetical protein LR48_Vigan10g123900 [Vigna angularis]|uniref:Uncharacterized protein n=1 Tax=Phaseolus angularis TaxID=3914 RepID=A0A0L9VKA1_PHAAN|nr:hypothetical protein LR48_Vigan10g123900 [Vigna angularis]
MNSKSRSLGNTPSSKQRGKALSKLNGKARSLGSTPRSKSERTSGKSLLVNVEVRAVKRSRFMLKDERYILPRQEGDRSVCANTDWPIAGVWKRTSDSDASAGKDTFDPKSN